MSIGCIVHLILNDHPDLVSKLKDGGYWYYLNSISIVSGSKSNSGFHKYENVIHYSYFEDTFHILEFSEKSFPYYKSKLGSLL